jgi:hypothetical protein
MSNSKEALRQGSVGSTANRAADLLFQYIASHQKIGKYSNNDELRTEIDKIVAFALSNGNLKKNNARSVSKEYYSNGRQLGFHGFVISVLMIEANYQKSTPTNFALISEVINEELTSRNVPPPIIYGDIYFTQSTGQKKIKEPSNCIICNLGSGKLIELRNFRKVHEKCLALDVSVEQNQIFADRASITDQINTETEKMLNLHPNYSLWGAFFGDPEEDSRITAHKTNLKDKIEKLNKQIKKLSLIDEKLKVKRQQYLIKHGVKINESIKYWPGYPPDYFWEELRSQALKKSRGRCKDCRKKNIYELHLHHLRPLSLGGLNEIENLITLCRSCHQKRHSHSFTDENSEYRSSSVNKKLTILGKIKLAKSTDKRLWIRYIDETGAQTERWLKVYQILHEKSASKTSRKWVEGYCELRAEDRSFRIDRIQMAKVYGMKHL